MPWVPLLLLASLGCPKRVTTDTSPVAALLAQCDQAWERRGMAGIEASEEPLDQAYALDPDNPDVLWRLVRQQVTIGLAEETERASTYAFAEGRSLGVRCLDAVPRVAQARAQSWELAMEELTPAQEPCVAWTSIAWARWIAAHGGGASALDLPRARLLADTSITFDSDELSTLGRWADGLLLATIPDWAGRSPSFGKTQLDRVRNRRRDDLHVHADRLLLVRDELGAEDVRTSLEEIRTLDATAPDHARALERVEASLAGPPPDLAHATEEPE